MNAIVCDKCNFVITNEDEMKDTLRLELCDGRVGKFSTKHLCENCAKKFYDWVKGE